ncbi:hypothetical protein BSKO_12079 [Bryopsis sp. KO-2023]|nr:hypothetical protein BSKO_12079 [Bryopsis sp. KO-2023]
MIFGPIFRTLQTFLGYVCPAYCTYKTIEAKDTNALQEWAMYWFVLALFSTVERILDAFLFWLPFYNLGKVFLVVYLWYPGLNGAQAIYNKVVRVNLGRYEPKIDEAVSEARTWAFDLFNHHKQNFLGLGRKYGFNVLAKLQGFSKKSGGNKETKKQG